MFEAPKELESMVLTDDKILIQADNSVQKTAGGLILHSWSRQNHLKGLVVLTGPGLLNKVKERVKLGVQAGDTILYNKDEGIEVSINGKKFVLFMNEKSIVGKLNE